MFQKVVTSPEFQNLTEDEIFKALNEPDENNPIAHEIARLIDGYTENFYHMVKNTGMPTHMLRHKSQYAIEEIAMQLTTETIRKSLEEKDIKA